VDLLSKGLRTKLVTYELIAGHVGFDSLLCDAEGFVAVGATLGHGHERIHGTSWDVRIHDAIVT